MRRVGRKSAVFDVPEEYKDKMQRLIDDIKQGDVYSLKGYEVLVVDSMEMMEDDER